MTIPKQARKMSQIKRWRPLLRKLYLRVHPDLFHNHCHDARVENEVSMQNLESALVSRPDSHIGLKFHILTKDRAEIQTVVKASIPAARSDDDWVKSVDRAVGVLLKPLLPKAVLDEEEEQGEDIEGRRVREEEERRHRLRGYFQSFQMSDLSDKDFNNELKKATLWNVDVNEAAEVVDVDECAKYLFGRGRMRASSKVDGGHAVRLIVYGLDELYDLDPTVLVKLGMPFMSDMTFVVVSGAQREVAERGRIVRLSEELSPEEFAVVVRDVVLRKQLESLL
eukprot:CAMPEP_0203759688 /NCGR_PEP_ID=MMETSP0098-20131031/12804_1 /ASSEMBLY_ACC=CAM_ASM_000208 /TAXON_ID=96639 /ORGANISM=" , Strain NY0313808BC1" /LENGTH=280 /DNA_ID=CAMNT_0050652819 /DNA_START=36 /DNA_END=878 /DNA_ORIENTATION=-